MRLKAKHSRKFYRSDAAYIRAVYVHNRKKIDSNISKEWVQTPEAGGDPYKAFKFLVESQMKYENPKTKKKYTVEEAIKREARSKDLNKEWDTADVYARNFHSKIRQDRKMMSKFYNYEKIKKIDYSKYEFLGYYSYLGNDVVVYRYNNSYFVEYQSPKGDKGGNLIFMPRSEFELYEMNGIISFKQYRKRN